MTTRATRTRLLLVGSLAGDTGPLVHLLRNSGAPVEQADTVEAALRWRLAGTGPATILCSTRAEASALAQALGRNRRATRLVVCVSHADPAPNEHGIEHLRMPADHAAIAALLGLELVQPPVAADPAMLATLRRAEQIAPTDASVLITGESGVGKEVLARYIHQSSHRAEGPFVALNCAAIPDTLLESELFGHEKGAFSGAVARRVGKFEAAHGGTLLLDEISEMDARLQAKLLRAIQEREIDRLGGSATIPVDVRILATTNRDINLEIARGSFRLDLYFRINVVTLRLPSLRDRSADIPILARHFAHRFARLNGLPDRPLTQAALRRLTEYDWPGNVRELENTMHRTVLLARGEDIDAGWIEFDRDPAHSPVGARSAPQVPLAGRRMEEVERDLILETLRTTFGNRTRAASLLGISIRALRNKLRDYAALGIEIPPPPSGVAVAAIAA